MSRGRTGASGPLVDKAAPGDVAGIERLRLGEQLRAHLGPEAVGADQHVRRLRRAIGKPRRYALRRLLDVPQVLAQMIVLATEGGAQHLEQAVPGGRRLRTGALRDHVARPIQHDPPLYRHPEVGAGVDAELRQSLAHLGMGHDAGAAAGERGRRALEDIRIPAAPAQVERREQPAHGAADDQGAASMLPHPLHPKPPIATSRRKAMQPRILRSACPEIGCRIAKRSALLLNGPRRPISALKKPHQSIGRGGPCSTRMPRSGGGEHGHSA